MQSRNSDYSKGKTFEIRLINLCFLHRHSKNSRKFDEKTLFSRDSEEKTTAQMSAEQSKQHSPPIANTLPFSTSLKPKMILFIY